MFSDRVFQVALVVSLVIHGAFLFHNPNFNLFNVITNKKEEALEISYVKKEAELKEKTRENLQKRELVKIPSKVTASKVSPPPFIEIDKEILARKNREVLTRQPDITRPAFIKPDVIAVKKKITLPTVDIDKIDNPSYLSYYQIVREKIRRAAYQNYTRTDSGEVYLSFVISREGFLTDVRLVEEKSSSSKYLREVALRSIREASPFPDFPKDLDYAQLSFNVIISFEIE